ncbi:Flp pilus assembly complex ATPase component TadA [Candidatus Peregrinibacteria bacterium]|nr:Flp pilus assembly complex ATPase component TadA [Candidatus Peregrinibacteria bacterium]
MNAFRDISGTSLAIRVIPEIIPNVESMGFTQEIINLTKKESGLVLVTGPTGSGKSTTLASLIEYINQNQQKHIITIEDPIEYSFHSKKCLIHQREV